MDGSRPALALVGLLIAALTGSGCKRSPQDPGEPPPRPATWSEAVIDPCGVGARMPGAVTASKREHRLGGAVIPTWSRAVHLDGQGTLFLFECTAFSFRVPFGKDEAAVREAMRRKILNDFPSEDVVSKASRDLRWSGHPGVEVKVVTRVGIELISRWYSLGQKWICLNVMTRRPAHYADRIRGFFDSLRKAPAPRAR